MIEKNRETLLSQPINICGGWCSVCDLFLKGMCNCLEHKTSHVMACRIKACAKSKETTCFECKEFPCVIIKHLQSSYHKDSRFYIRHMWIDNINYLKKYGEKEYKKRLLANKNMRMKPGERKPNRTCPCKHCKRPLKINLKKG